MSEDKTGRLLNLVATLRDSSVPLTADELRERVPEYRDYDSDASFRRTFERDKDELRRIGVELEVVMTEHLDPPVAAYRIPRDRYELPDAGLTPAELSALHAAATAVELRGIPEEEVTDAFRKLGGVGGAAAGHLAAMEVPDVLPELFGAVLERREVSFPYGGATRRLRPYRLQYERGRWYCSGDDLDREARRSFRVDRIEGPVTAGPPDAFRPPDHLGGVGLRPWEYGDDAPTDAVVHLDPVVAGPVLAEDPALDPEGTATAAAGVDLHLRVTDPSALIGWVLSFGERAELLGPPELRARLVGHLESLARDPGSSGAAA